MDYKCLEGDRTRFKDTLYMQDIVGGRDVVWAIVLLWGIEIGL